MCDCGLERCVTVVDAVPATNAFIVIITVLAAVTVISGLSMFDVITVWAAVSLAAMFAAVTLLCRRLTHALNKHPNPNPN